MLFIYWNLFNYSPYGVNPDCFEVFANVITPGVNVAVHILLYVDDLFLK